jgi:hypothetical protein
VSTLVRRWAAWAPGLEDAAAWVAWCRAPAPLAADGAPVVAFLPPLFRRRCGRLSRMMLRVAFDCCPPDELARVTTVFASRYGDMTATVGLLEALARQEPLKASRFSHSVHNTQAGLFSIAAGNRQASCAMAAGHETFPCAFLEAQSVLTRGTGTGVLLVVGDEPLPPVLAPFADDPPAAYAVALLLASAPGDAAGVALQLGAGGEPGAPPWPPAIEFLRWLLSAESGLTLGSGRRRWTWRRGQRAAEAAATSC